MPRHAHGSVTQGAATAGPVEMAAYPPAEGVLGWGAFVAPAAAGFRPGAAEAAVGGSRTRVRIDSVTPGSRGQVAVRFTVLGDD